MPELMNLLREKGKEVYLVSGGFTQLILPTARQVTIDFLRKP